MSYIIGKILKPDTLPSTKRLNIEYISRCDNMAKKKGEGFHSAAGLIRYFDDEDEKSPKIPPWVVIIMCVGSAVVVTVAAWLWPT